MLIVVFAGAFRSSELAAIDSRDLTFCDEGLIVDLRRSKTDQAASDRKVGLTWGSDEIACPVRALRRWLDAAGIANGAVFRSIDRHGRISPSALNKNSVRYILKRTAERAGMQTETLGGHSLRAGHVTQSARNGTPEYIIMLQTGHRSSATLRPYISCSRRIRRQVWESSRGSPTMRTRDPRHPGLREKRLLASQALQSDFSADRRRKPLLGSLHAMMMHPRNQKP